MPDIGIVDLKAEILENFTNLYKNSVVSDVILSVKGAKLSAHRFALAAHSKFFQVLLYGQGFNEANQPEVPVDAPANAMKMLLEFSYSGMLDLRTFDLVDVADLLELAHRFEMTKLENLVAEYLCNAVDEVNASYILDVATLVGRKKLQERCWMIIEMVVEGIYGIELNLTYTHLEELLRRLPRKVTEVKLFQAVCKLTQKENFCTEKQKNEIFERIQYSRMTEGNLLSVVEPSKVLPAQKILELIQTGSLHTARVLDDHSVAISKFAKVIKGQNPEFLFQTGDQFTELPANDDNNCISVDLGALCVFNSLKFNISLGGIFYCIETSKTGDDWTRVIDYSESLCYDKQELHFSEIVARYVKIRENCAFATKELMCNSFEVYYLANCPKFLCGLTMPAENVATLEKANFSKSENKFELESQLLNGMYEDTGIDTPFTAQVFKYGSLIVHFQQPYLISSCRFRLWDFDGRKYSYVVEVTSDLDIYDIISDKTEELLGGWQQIHFTPRPVVQFRITGTKATIGNELRLVHFEAPAQDSNI